MLIRLTLTAPIVALVAIALTYAATVQRLFADLAAIVQTVGV